MNEVKKCFKCGSEKNVIKHHISYEPEIIVDCCRKCHRNIHIQVRKEGRCKYSVDKTNILSKTSSKKRNCYIFEYQETMMPNVSLAEHTMYNKSTGHITYTSYFRVHRGKKLWIENI